MNIDNKLSEALETLVVRIVHKVMSSPEFISRFSDAITGNPEIITQVAALVESN